MSNRIQQAFGHAKGWIEGRINDLTTSVGDLTTRVTALEGGGVVRNGVGPPSPFLGNDGDFYIDTAADNLYGPKTGGVWNLPTSLVGPAGAPGTPAPTPEAYWGTGLSAIAVAGAAANLNWTTPSINTIGATRLASNTEFSLPSACNNKLIRIDFWVQATSVNGTCGLAVQLQINNSTVWTFNNYIADGANGMVGGGVSGFRYLLHNSGDTYRLRVREDGTSTTAVTVPSSTQISFLRLT